MKNIDELSWTEQFGQIQLLSKLDEATLEIDMLKLKYEELRREARMYEKLYHETLKKVWSIGL